MTYKHILISDKNYRKLKALGSAGDSFNDVITGILEKMNSLQQPLNGVAAPVEIVVNTQQTDTLKKVKDCQ